MGLFSGIASIFSNVAEALPGVVNGIAGALPGISGLISDRAAMKGANAQLAQQQKIINELNDAFGYSEKKYKPFYESGANQLPSLERYSSTGIDALNAMRNYLGLNGLEEQKNYLQNFENNPLMQSLNRQGEQAILANASATGGLRGGNTQNSLYNLRADLFAKMLGDNFDKLSGIANSGLNVGNNLAAFGANAANNTVNSKYNSVNNIIQALGNQGDLMAMKKMAQADMWNQGFSIPIGMWGGR